MQMPQQFTRNTTPIANASDQATTKTKDENLKSDRPTPETDAAAWTETNWANAIVLAKFARKLERERDEAWKEIDLLKTNLRIQTEHTENAVQDRADEHIELHNQIHELTEERDEARAEVELLRRAPLRQRCQELERLSEHFCDMHTVAAKQRDAAQEQRDRLAETLRREIISELRAELHAVVDNMEL